MDHTLFDQRQYPILPVREGYGEWARTYDGVVQDEMDLRLLARLTTVDWAARTAVLDLACGTGRIGAWLRSQGVARLDGLDLTPEMLTQAGPAAATTACRWPTCGRRACRTQRMA